MKEEHYKMVVIIGLFTLVGLLFATLLLTSVESQINRIKQRDEIEYTDARPILQQKIGDDVNPDTLIIYEAEVDGEKVYPSVIKEAK